MTQQHLSHVVSPGLPELTPDAAVALLCAAVQAVGVERVALGAAVGRVLAQEIATDRDNPPCDVSAMDGFAVRLADLQRDVLPVVGEVAMGQEPPELVAGCALKIFTGGAVPSGTQAIVQREYVVEQVNAIVPGVKARQAKMGDNIRHRGENAIKGTSIVPSGKVITPSIAAALAAFGYAHVSVHRKIRIALLTTGNELVSLDQSPQTWQWRDSNGPALRAFVGSLRWAELSRSLHVRDDLQTLTAALANALLDADVVLLTGGVSAGDHDHVPNAVVAVGGRILFHKLPLRPGKPVLGAVGPNGQCIMGLPGNPVAVLTTSRRLALPVLRRMSGLSISSCADAMVRLTNHDEKTLNLWWYRPVMLREPDVAELIDHRGSGDIVAAARTDGLIEVPPGICGAGPYPYFGWSPR